MNPLLLNLARAYAKAAVDKHIARQSWHFRTVRRRFGGSKRTLTFITIIQESNHGR